MPVLLGFVGLVLDVGHAYSVQRKLQATADAAALAGASQLQSGLSTAVATASAYGAKPGEKNPLGTDPVSEAVTTKCLATFPGCTTANALTVSETATVSTAFAKIFGINTISVRATSTACSPCGSKPLDIMIVLDRTLSMCMDDSDTLYKNYPPDQSGCVDLNNARSGISTFLTLLDPSLDHVGLAVLPPAPSVSTACSPLTATQLASTLSTAYDSQSAPYVLVPLSSNYATKQGTLNPSSSLVTTLNCVPPMGETAYAKALDAAETELQADGRAGVQKVIVFFSDGAANTGPSWAPASYRTAPCHQGITDAAAIKAAGTLIYSMGYDLTANGEADTCRSNSYQGPAESPAISSTTALEDIATQPSAPYFTQKPGAGDLTTLFQDLAANLLAGTANLVDNSTP